MLASGVDAVPAVQSLQTAKHIVGAACGDVVQIQRNEVAAGDGVGLPARAVQGTGNEAAHILHLILLAFGKIQIFRQRFLAPGGQAQALIKFGQPHELRRPLHSTAAGAGRDRDLSVIYHVQHISCLPQGVNLSWARPASCSRKRAYLEIPKPAKKQGQKLVSILAFLRSPYRGLRFRYRTCGFITWGLFEPERELPKAVLKWRQKKVVILHRSTAPAMGWQIQVVIRQRKTVWVFCAWSVCSRVAPKKCFRRDRRKTLFRRPSVGYT